MLPFKKGFLPGFGSATRPPPNILKRSKRVYFKNFNTMIRYDESGVKGGLE